MLLTFFLNNNTQSLPAANYFSEPNKLIDPRKELLESLIHHKQLFNSGTPILVFNKEKTEACLKNLSKALPEYSTKVNSLLDRLVDLQVVFKDNYYSDPRIMNTDSMEEILSTFNPTLCDRRLNISTEISARTSYLQLMYDPKYNLPATYEELKKYLHMRNDSIYQIFLGIKSAFEQFNGVKRAA